MGIAVDSSLSLGLVVIGRLNVVIVVAVVDQVLETVLVSVDIIRLV